MKIPRVSFGISNPPGDKIKDRLCPAGNPEVLEKFLIETDIPARVIPKQPWMGTKNVGYPTLTLCTSSRSRPLPAQGVIPNARAFTSGRRDLPNHESIAYGHPMRKSSLSANPRSPLRKIPPRDVKQ
jgi:hypothetical protein